jgi:hypothetical protein
MKKLLMILLLGTAINTYLNAQVKIGDNPNSIQSSTILELESTNKGFLPPRISLASLTDATTIPSPAPSLLIFNTNAALIPGAGYYYNAGTSGAPEWVKMVSMRDSIVKSITPSGEVIALSRFPMGEVSMNGNTTITNISGANVWTKIAGTTNFTPASYQFTNGGVSNKLQYVGANMKMFHIACTISVKSTSSGSNLKAVLYKNGVALTTGIVQAKMASSSDIISTAIHVMTDMSTNDYLELWITNTVSNADFTITEMNLFAMGVSMGMD